jgi:hypothetical protein
MNRTMPCAARARVGFDDDVESLLRSALERLTRNSWGKASSRLRGSSQAGPRALGGAHA